MTISRRGAIAGLAVAPLLQQAANAQGAAFPSRPLTLIVPFPAGGPADIFGRYLAQGMTANLKQQVVVENKSGAAGVTGMDVVAKATDAHTMGIYSASAGAIMQSLMDKMPYRPGIDLAGDGLKDDLPIYNAGRTFSLKVHDFLHPHSFRQAGDRGDIGRGVGLVHATLQNRRAFAPCLPQ